MKRQVNASTLWFPGSGTKQTPPCRQKSALIVSHCAMYPRSSWELSLGMISSSLYIAGSLYVQGLPRSNNLNSNLFCFLLWTMYQEYVPFHGKTGKPTSFLPAAVMQRAVVVLFCPSLCKEQQPPLTVSPALLLALAEVLWEEGRARRRTETRARGRKAKEARTHEDSDGRPHY